MRSVSAQLSVAGVADQLHGKSSEKLASAIWIRPVGRLPGHFTRVEAITNRAFGKIPMRHGGGEGRCAPAVGRDRRSGRDEPSRRFSVRKRRDVGHRKGPWTGCVLKLPSRKKACFSTACGDTPRPNGGLFA
jgi:hypothetical protein